MSRVLELYASLMEEAQRLARPPIEESIWLIGYHILTPFQVIKYLVFFTYIIFAIHLDIYYV
jgi:hypothetical protein